MKAKPKSDYQITPVRLVPDVKKKVRLLAAQNDTSMAEMTGRLLSLGLAAYEKRPAGRRPLKEARA